MEAIAGYIKRIATWPYFWLCLFVLLTLCLHAATIIRPAELVLDEQHYVKDARGIIGGEPTQRPEHPSLAKLMIVSSMVLFGDNPVGWRFFSVLFGALNVALLWLICRRLGLPKRAVNLCTFLFSIENLGFVLSGVAMLDVFTVTFLMSSFWLYLRNQWALSGVMIGLSALAKLTGALALVAIYFHWILACRKRPVAFLVLTVLAPVSFLALMPIVDYFTFHAWMNPFERVQTMLSLSGSLTFASVTTDVASRPWIWVLLPLIMPFWYNPTYMAAISFTLWALIIPSMVYMGYRALKGDNVGLFVFAWFFGTYLMWIPMSIVTDRISFIFYFLPTVGSICLAVGIGLYDLVILRKSIWGGRKTKLIMVSVLVILGLHVANFVLLSPVFNWNWQFY
jgi:dolichyl-phosphate-mannose-protein mannosyltransferase